MSKFVQSQVSTSSTFIRRIGETSIQWSRPVEPTSPNVWPQLVEGQMVTLDDTTGNIIVATGTGERPLGVVLTPNNIRNNQTATIVTFGQAIVRASASASLDFGESVTLLGTALINDIPRPVAATATTGTYATGYCLTSASAASEEVEVLLFHSPVYIP